MNIKDMKFLGIECKDRISLDELNVINSVYDLNTKTLFDYANILFEGVYEVIYGINMIRLIGNDTVVHVHRDVNKEWFVGIIDNGVRLRAYYR